MNALANSRWKSYLDRLYSELQLPATEIHRRLMEMVNLKPGEEAEMLIQSMTQQADQLSQLVKDLLDVARYNRGRVALRKELVSLRPIVESAIEEARPLITESSQVLSVNWPGESVTIDGDRSRLIQVMSNLLINASKYSGPGCRINVELATEQNSAVVRFSDNGIGIAKNRIGRIFQMFEQLNQGSPGLGIGLALVRSIVMLHGGDICCSSDGIGRGSCFTVKLPMHRSQTAQV